MFVAIIILLLQCIELLCVYCIICIISTSYYYQCYRHYNHLNKQPWYGLWWIILLQYTHLAQTAMSILHCPRLPDRSGNIAPVSKYLLVRHIQVSSGIKSFERFKLSQFYQQTVYIHNNKPCIFKTFIVYMPTVETGC